MKGKTSRVLQMLLVIICVNLLMLFEENGKVQKTLDSVDRDEEEPQQQQQQQQQQQHLSQEWHDWFQPLSTWSPMSAALAVDSSAPTRDDSIHQVLFYHVMKAGGSSLYRMFYRMSLKYQHNVDQCGWTGQCCGVERPGKLSIFVNHWKSLPSVHPKLLAIAFREPVERTISHYFQVKPCPDGSGGGSDRRCTHNADNGLSSFLNGCYYSSNFQIKYLDDRFENLQHVDVVLRSDRIEESLVLMSIKYKIPILDLIYTRDKVKLSGEQMEKGQAGENNKGNRTPHDESHDEVLEDDPDRHFPGFEFPDHREPGSDRDQSPDDRFLNLLESDLRRKRRGSRSDSRDDSSRENWKELQRLKHKGMRGGGRRNLEAVLIKERLDRRRKRNHAISSLFPRRGNSSGESCTLQWMKQMLSEEALETLQNCTFSCAGLMGRLAFKEHEIDEIKALNQRDLILWNDHVIPRYERDKANILQQYNVTQKDLNAIVALYSTVQKDFEQQIPRKTLELRPKNKRRSTCKNYQNVTSLQDSQTREETNLKKTETKTDEDNTDDDDEGDDDLDDDNAI